MICWLFVFLRKPINESDAKSDAWFENDVQMFFDVFVDGLSMFVSAYGSEKVWRRLEKVGGGRRFRRLEKVGEGWRRLEKIEKV